uniref:NADH-ubiquinone oxidoreductase chain 6 n=1 Tax=Paracoccidioides sp. 'americana' TaxID=2486200 RepID=A0A7H1DNM1_9EURO|nr:NADH dehydrogenase subunit 6 [Paracoccidioides sp. 'americana']
MFLIYDNFNFGYYDNSLDILYLICILFGLYTILNKNPIISIFFLIGLFSSISCYLFLIGFEFIGLSYLLVYIGAVSILFLFILMLINLRISELTTKTTNSLPLAIFSFILFIFILNLNLPINTIDNPEIIYVISLNWDNILINNTQISSIGNILYTNYSLWLIILSVILLLAMVGSIVITLNKNK